MAELRRYEKESREVMIALAEKAFSFRGMSVGFSGEIGQPIIERAIAAAVEAERVDFRTRVCAKRLRDEAPPSEVERKGWNDALTLVCHMLELRIRAGEEA